MAVPNVWDLDKNSCFFFFYLISSTVLKPVACVPVVSHRVCQVVEKLIRGLAMEDSRNMFALFEHNDTTEKAIESRTVVADVLAKFEK